MPRFTRPTIAALPVACLLASPAAAQDQDAQLWLYLNGNFSLSDSASATIEISPRWLEGNDQLLLRATGEYRLAEGVVIGGGAAYVDYQGGHEFRPHQQLTLTTGPLAARTRIEQRFFAGADRAQIRLRQRLQVSAPVSEGLRASASGEFLTIARSQRRGANLDRDQWRGELALRQRITAETSLGLAYRALYTPRQTREDTLTHVAAVTLTWRP